MNPFSVASISQEIKLRNGRLRLVIYSGAALALFAVWVMLSAKRDIKVARQEQQEVLRENFKVFVAPLSHRIDSLARQNDSLKKTVERMQNKMQREFDLYFAPVKPESKPIRWDTTKIFEQKTEEKK